MERRLEPDGARLVVGKDAQAEPLVVTGDQAEVVSQLANRSIGESADGRVCVFRGQGKMKIKKKEHVPAILLHLALNLIVTHRRVLEHRILSAQRNERAVKHHQPCPRHASATRPDYRKKNQEKKEKKGEAYVPSSRIQALPTPPDRRSHDGCADKATRALLVVAAAAAWTVATSRTPPCRPTGASRTRCERAHRSSAGRRKRTGWCRGWDRGSLCGWRGVISKGSVDWRYIYWKGVGVLQFDELLVTLTQVLSGTRHVHVQTFGPESHE